MSPLEVTALSEKMYNLMMLIIIQYTEWSPTIIQPEVSDESMETKLTSKPGELVTASLL